MATSRATDYSAVTEKPGNAITTRALSAMVTRYELAAREGADKDVLEVGCGTGQGLGLIARKARSVVGADYTQRLATVAQRHYGDRVPVLRFDAQALPFADASFDVVVLYEAIYYVPDPRLFMDEASRVLRSGGVLLVCSANPELPDFNPSPNSFRYFSASELGDLLSDAGFSAELAAAFEVNRSVIGTLVSVLKRLAVRLDVMPKTMRSKALLKRIFLGPVLRMPLELAPDSAPEEALVPVRGGQAVRGHQVVYAVGRLS